MSALNSLRLSLARQTTCSFVRPGHQQLALFSTTKFCQSSNSSLNEALGDLVKDYISDKPSNTNVNVSSSSTTTAAAQQQNDVKIDIRGKKPGLLISPHHLNPDHIGRTPPSLKPRALGPNSKEVKDTDPFLYLDFAPKDAINNPRILLEFVSDLGRIKPRSKTGLSYKNHKRVAKAIRRARAMGLMSHWSKPMAHPPNSNAYS